MGDRPDEDDELLDDEEDPWDHIEIVRAKWTMDGATTLSEAAGMLRREADYLEELERDGWQLIQPVEHDYGHIADPDSTKRLSVKVEMPLGDIDQFRLRPGPSDRQGHDREPPLS